MRSDTLLSLDEFVAWLGGDAWLFAQIDRTSAVSPKIADKTCNCTLQYEWQPVPKANSGVRAGGNSRQMIIQAIQRAEALFSAWTGVFPAPVCVTGERHPYTSFVLRNQQRRMVKPAFAAVQAMGTCVLTEVGSGVAITRTDGPALLDVFTITLTVPADTTADQIRVYLPGTTAELKNEIRPLNVLVDTGTWTATMTGPAYLFVKPEFYEALHPECLKHEAATYLETVDVFVESVDRCAQGVFLLSGDCQSEPCAEPDTVSLCLRRNNKVKGEWYTPDPARCVEGQLKTLSACAPTDAVRINYVAGLPRTGGRMNESAKVAVAMLATGLIVCAMEVCCQACETSRFDYFREIQKFKTKGENRLQGGAFSGEAYELLATPQMIATLNGLEPRRGILQAYQLISVSDWLNETASVIFS